MHTTTKILAALALATVPTTALAGPYKYTVRPAENQEITYSHGQPQVTAAIGANFVSILPKVDATGRPAFALVVINQSGHSFEIDQSAAALAYADGKPIRIYTSDELTKKAQSTAFWAAALASMAADLNNTNYSTTTVHGTYGSATVHGQWTDRYAANAERRAAYADIAAYTAGRMDEIGNVIERTTVADGVTFTGLVVSQKLSAKTWPAVVTLSLTIDGTQRAFTFEVSK